MKQYGFTSIELFTVITISSLLITVGVPPLIELVGKNRAQSITNHIVRSAQYAREFAITHRRSVYFCGSTDGTACEKKWSTFLIAFLDNDGDKQLSEADELILKRYLNLKKGNMTTRAASRKIYTVFSPQGTAKYPGSMIFCPHSGDPKFAGRVTWNRLGRPYKGWDKNKDGYIEDTNRKKINCS